MGEIYVSHKWAEGVHGGERSGLPLPRCGPNRSAHLAYDEKASWWRTRSQHCGLLRRLASEGALIFLMQYAEVSGRFLVRPNGE